MNLRALAAADPDTRERQRNCGAVPVGSQVEIRMKDGSAYYCGLETCGNVWLCPADYYQTGDTRDRDLWREYARVTRSLAAVRWSRSLRTAVNGSAIGAERTDEELAAQDVGGNQLAVLEFPAWARILAAGLEHAVLVAAEHGGLRAVDSLIDRPPAEYEQHLAQQSLVA